MNTKTDAGSNGKAPLTKRIVTTAIVIIVLLILVWTARDVVNTIDIVGFLKTMHGG